MNLWFSCLHPFCIYELLSPAMRCLASAIFIISTYKCNKLINFDNRINFPPRLTVSLELSSAFAPSACTFYLNLCLYKGLQIITMPWCCLHSERNEKRSNNTIYSRELTRTQKPEESWQKSKSTPTLYYKSSLVVHFTQNKEQLSDSGQKIQPELKTWSLTVFFAYHSSSYSSYTPNMTTSFPSRGCLHLYSFVPGTALMQLQSYTALSPLILS